MSLLRSLKPQNFQKNLDSKARRGIDFPTLFVRICGVVLEILAQEEKNVVSKCYSGCFFGNFIAQGATPKKKNKEPQQWSLLHGEELPSESKFTEMATRDDKGDKKGSFLK